MCETSFESFQSFDFHIVAEERAHMTMMMQWRARDYGVTHLICHILLCHVFQLNSNIIH